MAERIPVTFTWPSDCTGADGARMEPLTFELNLSALNEIDPDGSSLLSAKLRFARENGEDVDAKGITLSAEGPHDDECMTHAAVRFVMQFVHSASVLCPDELEGDDAERLLDFFGFPGRTITIQETDPAYLGKLLAYSRYRSTLDAAPLIGESIKTAMLNHRTSIETRIFVVDTSKWEWGQFGDRIDHVIDKFPGKGTAIVTRLGESHGQAVKYFAMLNGEDKASRALRSNVRNCVMKLGGLNAEWAKHSVIVADHGEYGNKEFVRDHRWALQIKMAKRASEDSGIKRRKIDA